MFEFFYFYKKKIAQNNVNQLNENTYAWKYYSKIKYQRIYTYI